MVLAEGALGPGAVRAALQLHHFDYEWAWRAMAPQGRRFHQDPNEAKPTPAAVLLLLFPRAGSWHFILTKRSADLRGHSGQISLPGGRIDPDDGSAWAAALRETEEELGIATAGITRLGALTPLLITHSQYFVRPQVGWLDYEPRWRPNAGEVAGLLVMSLAQLLDPLTKDSERRDLRGDRVRVPYYRLAGQQVWGATALILSELERRLRRALAGPEPSLAPVLSHDHCSDKM